jgi:N-acetylglucosamine-6-phosphate deacetylase
MHWHTNLRLPLPAEDGRRWRLGVADDGRIASLQPLPPGSCGAGDDWGGDWLSPAGIDLQINGGLGLPFPDLEPGKLPQLLQLLDHLWVDGVEAISPTLVTCGVAPLRTALAVLHEARGRHRAGRCRLLGAHLEGPFLAPERRGAHPAEHLAAPSLEALQARIGGFEDGIAMVTLAPELPGAAAVIEALHAQGMVVCLGHSGADEGAARSAFDRGVTMLTHAFNAMPGLHHRAPGPVGAALDRSQVTLGLIADGVHVAPTMAVLLQRLLPDRVVLVSDALAPYGLPPGDYPWDARTIRVEDGSCRLADGTLAGTTLGLLDGVVRLAGWTGDDGAAIRAATVLPRHVLGDRRSPAELLIGQPLTAALRWHRPAAGPLGWHRPMGP